VDYNQSLQAWHYASHAPTPDYTAGWHPLDTVPFCLFAGNTKDCSNGGKRFPPQHMLGGVIEGATSKSFSFTTETHTIFTYTGVNQVFQFSGDDDLWVFINNKLAIDVGGLHPASTSTIDLDDPYVASYLGLEVGGIYPLDLYNAERHTTESNFAITTSLSFECSIILSGGLAYSWNNETLAEDWKLIGGPVSSIVVNGSAIQLTSVLAPSLASYAFLREQVNIGPGFVVNFNFVASAQGSGFVFGLVPQTITNLNGGSGGALGFRNMNASWAIAFDFCADRDDNPGAPACASRETRMHYLPWPSSPDNVSASSATKQKYATLYVPNELNDGYEHQVMVRYYGERPPWVEVYIDNILFLLERNISMPQVLGTTKAWAGFTAGTGATPQETSDIFITNFEVRAVAIADQKTVPYDMPNVTQSVVADGFHFIEFSIQVSDLCGNVLTFGGHPEKALGYLMLSTPTSAPTVPWPSASPVLAPSQSPTGPTTSRPSTSPVRAPSNAPSINPSMAPTPPSTFRPTTTVKPTTHAPTSKSPSLFPTHSPTTSKPTHSPTTSKPSKSPSAAIAGRRRLDDEWAGNDDDDVAASSGGGVGAQVRVLSEEAKRLLVTSTAAMANQTLFGAVRDNDDGTYTFVFNTTSSGVFDLYMFFGTGCFNNGTAESGLHPVNAYNASICFHSVNYAAAEFFPTTPAPTYGNDNPAAALGSAALSGIGVAAGVICGVGCLLIAIGIRVRNRWRHDKEFIEAGRIAAAERGVQYLGDNELDRLQNQLQKTLEELSRERAKKALPDDQEDTIRALLRQKGELQETVRQLKIRAQGGDPNAPVESRMSRVRRSFAHSQYRVSIDLAGRQSRGASMARGAFSRISLFRGTAAAAAGTGSVSDEDGGQHMATDNPSFQRNSLFRNPFASHSSAQARTAPSASIKEVAMPEI